MKLIEDFQKQKSLARWDVPFPMGVFGTLRMGWGNNRLMRGYSHMQRAFLPHFAPTGLHIDFVPGVAGMFEVYFYTPENWEKMIPSVDALEGFHPKENPKGWFYWRTLVNLRLLPEDFPEDQYGWRETSTSTRRVLDIPMEDWEKYPQTASWVYSSIEQNKICVKAKIDHDPIIWFNNDDLS